MTINGEKLIVGGDIILSINGVKFESTDESLLEISKVMGIKKGNLASFLKAIGTPHDQIWDEKIWNTKIEIDGGIAQVWTDYAFYVGTEFSHCGVDAFHLIKDEEKGWKIVHLMDTRRKEGCEILNK